MPEDQAAGSAGETARPFVKWVGGKRRIAAEILGCVPQRFGNYYEPFVGGGALYFELAAAGGRSFGKAFLSDANSELIAAFETVKSDISLKRLIRLLREHGGMHSREHFARVRSGRKRPGSVEESARFIYLNKTCYNGLYRVNSQGEFNAPIGSYANPRICDEENLRSCHRALAGVEVSCRDFEASRPGRGDVVYCDPPYHDTFDSYTRQRFDEGEQRRLAGCCDRWARKGVTVLVSNAITPLIDGLYPAGRWNRRELRVSRSVNSNGNGRKPVPEWLISNAPV